MKKFTEETHKTLLSSAFQVARSSGATAVFVSLDPLKEPVDGQPPKGCRLIFTTRLPSEEVRSQLPEGSDIPIIQLPNVNMTRMGHVKMAVVLALATKLIAPGEKVVFVTGPTDRQILDSIVAIDTAKESEILTCQGVDGIAEGVHAEVFQETLSIALELAGRGREGKPVGTIFIMGDEEKVLQLSKQMIINPFKGYTDDERNILSPTLRETIREFAALDGAFIISKDGRVLTAGRHLGVAVDEEMIPRGLGSRHIAAAGMTALTKAIAIVVSESTGDLRIFRNGKILMTIEKPVRLP